MVNTSLQDGQKLIRISFCTDCHQKATDDRQAGDVLPQNQAARNNLNKASKSATSNSFSGFNQFILCIKTAV